MEIATFNGSLLRVISTIRFYLILCIVKQYERHVSQVVGNGSHIKNARDALCQKHAMLD